METKQKKEFLEKLTKGIEVVKDGDSKNPFVALFTSPKFYISLIIPFLLTIVLLLATLKYAIIVVSIALGLSLHPLLKTIAESFNLINEEHGN